MDELQAGVIIGGIFVLLIFMGIISHFVPLGLWISASFSGVPVSITGLINMRIRNIPQHMIIRPLIMAQQAGITYLSISDLESYYLQGGRVQEVISALIAASKANIDLTFQQACAIDRAGRDVLSAVRMSVNPKVMQTPEISAVAADGIELKAVCRITVRANIERLVGGAGEDTVLARVQEGMCTAIGSAEHFQNVLESPELISKTVLNKGLDQGTAFELLSIDIADIDVGKNIGADLQINQALADKEIAQAKAETRRAEANAREQEMKAKIQQMKAKFVEAQAQIPKAMADALQSGKLSVADYYSIKNLLADTAMRQSLAGGSLEQ